MFTSLMPFCEPRELDGVDPDVEEVDVAVPLVEHVGGGLLVGGGGVPPADPVVADDPGLVAAPAPLVRRPSGRSRSPGRGGGRGRGGGGRRGREASSSRPHLSAVFRSLATCSRSDGDGHRRPVDADRGRVPGLAPRARGPSRRRFRRRRGRPAPGSSSGRVPTARSASSRSETRRTMPGRAAGSEGRPRRRRPEPSRSSRRPSASTRSVSPLVSSITSRNIPCSVPTTGEA